MSSKDPKPMEIDAYAMAWVLEKQDKTYCYKKAFPNSKAKPKTMNEMASVFHSSHKVSTRIDQLQQISKKQTEEEFKVEVAEIKKMLLIGAKDGLKHRKSYWVPALSELNRMDGNHAAVKQEVSFQDMSDSEIDERLKSLIAE